MTYQEYKDRWEGGRPDGENPLAPLEVAIGFIEDGLKGTEEIENAWAGLDDMRLHFAKKGEKVMEFSTEIQRAIGLVQDAYYDERGMQDVMRKDAAIYASIAQTKAMERIAAALEKLAGCIRGDWFTVEVKDKAF